MWCDEHGVSLNVRTRICPTVRMAYQHLDAGNDRGGHPRRAYVIYDLADGEIVTAIDEGYLGIKALSQAGFDRQQLVQLPGYQISAADYDQLMQEHTRGLIEWPLSQIHKPR
ncbi:MAG TPA: hypothetical protein VLO13_04105 [Halomonas sp.]|nr:hypothetical protein [Halomonas sp.]